MFHAVFEEQYYGAFLLLGYFAIHFALFYFVSKRMYKKDMLNRAQHCILFFMGALLVFSYYLLAFTGSDLPRLI